MAKHDDINASSMNPDDEWVDSIEEAMAPPLSSVRIHRVPERLMREESDYERYYVPKVVSIGPYHHGNSKLELVEKLKPVFTKELLSKYNVDLKNLFNRLGEANMVQGLRKFYEERSTDHLSDKEFTKMMLLDGCFILYYIHFIYGKKAGYGRELIRSHQIVLIRHDLFLLENQIPFNVLNQVMKLIDIDRDTIDSFITGDIFAQERQKRGWFGFGTNSTQNDESDHLLDRLYCSLTRTSKVKTQNFRGYPRSNIYIQKKQTVETSNRRTFHNVNELKDMGINFKPSSSMYLDDVKFVRRYWSFSADLKLPPITVNRLLNLLVYELCSDYWHDAWVISYVCLLDSLIDEPEDVTALRNAGVLDNPLGNESDKEVAKMFNEIGIYLVPNDLAYSKVTKRIQTHYDRYRWRIKQLSELKNEYFKSPWSTIAVLGGMMIFLFSGVQTYFTVWSPKSDCDDLCKFLKMNHHL